MKPLQKSLELKFLTNLLRTINFVNISANANSFQYLPSTYSNFSSKRSEWKNEYPIGLTRNSAIITRTVCTINILNTDGLSGFNPYTFTLSASPSYLIKTLTGLDLNSVTTVLGDTVIPVCDIIFNHLNEAEKNLKKAFIKIINLKEVIDSEDLYKKFLNLETLLFTGKGIYQDSCIKIYGCSNCIPDQVYSLVKDIRFLIRYNRISISKEDFDDFINCIENVFFFDYKTIPLVYLS